MNATVSGIHHVTAIAGDAQRNLDFYAGILGLRLVKRTVNFDDPGTYHFYYGDGQGSPGTILTFFPWNGAPRGQRGAGQTTAVAFAIRPTSVAYWQERLTAHAIAVEGPTTRFEETVLTFADPDNMIIELIATPNIPERAPWTESAIPAEHALQGFHSVTLSEANLDRTEALLTQTLNFRKMQQQENRYRYAIGTGDASTILDILWTPQERTGRVAAGSVHHIALRTPDDAQQAGWLEELTRLRYGVSPVMDRDYFHSIYFREPGGVLFEIATDPPGFTVDEPLSELGTNLKLPPWLEPQRQEIEAVLPPIQLPTAK